MERLVLMDKLSEYLMVEQCGFQLYRIVAARAEQPELRERYEEFGRETAHHREILVRLITELGGDPDYVSPCARLAQAKAESLMAAGLVVDGLSPLELAANDLENVLIAETKDFADWTALTTLAQQVGEPAVREALERAIAEAGPQEEEHLRWAGAMLEQLCLRMVTDGPAPSPEFRLDAIVTPVPGIAELHPAPIPAEAGLLPPAQLPPWGAPPVARSLAASGV